MGTKIYADIELMTNPASGKSLVNKDYVDAAVSRKIKDAVTAVSAENFEGSYDAGNKTLTQTTPAVAVIDGVELAEGDRVLLAGQTDAAQNGIYAVITAGSDSTAAVLARAEDFNDTAKIVLNVMIPDKLYWKYLCILWLYLCHLNVFKRESCINTLLTNKN